MVLQVFTYDSDLILLRTSLTQSHAYKACSLHSVSLQEWDLDER